MSVCVLVKQNIADAVFLLSKAIYIMFVFTLERFTEVLERNYLDKHFAFVNAS